MIDLERWSTGPPKTVMAEIVDYTRKRSTITGKIYFLVKIETFSLPPGQGLYFNMIVSGEPAQTRHKHRGVFTYPEDAVGIKCWADLDVVYWPDAPGGMRVRIEVNRVRPLYEHPQECKVLPWPTTPHTKPR